MSGLRIAPFFEVSHDDAFELGAVANDLQGTLDQAFVVLTGGYGMGVWWKRGDVIVCGRHALGRANVVLVPRGYGWPRLGRQASHGELSGDSGEPCRMDRWVVVGAVRHVLRRQRDGVWQIAILGEALESPLDMASASWDEQWVPVSVQGRSGAGRDQRGGKGKRQLCLFSPSALAA